MKRTPQQWISTLEQQKCSLLPIQEFFQPEKISTSGFYKYKKLMTNNSRCAIVKNAPSIQESVIDASNTGSNERIS